MCDALASLVTSPLYIQYQIKVDGTYVYQFSKRYDKTVDFVLDKNDEDVLTECLFELDDNIS